MKVAITVLVFLALSLLSCDTTPDPEGNGIDTYAKYVQALTAQLQANPDSVGLRLQLASFLDSTGKYSEALIQMDSLIAKDPANFGLWFTQARIAEDGGDTLLAMKSYDKALHIYPSADAMVSLANLYAEQKNENALVFSTRIKQLALGRDYDAHAAFVAGVYYARIGDQQMALRSFDECIANNYTYMEAYIEKGLVYFDNKRYREALNVFSFAASVNALDADPYYWQGRSYEMMNIKDSAILRFKQSLSLDKNAPETKEALKRLGE